MPKDRFRLIVRAHWRDKKIGEFSGNVHIYSKREVLKINRFPLVVFFRKKFSRAESCAEECAKYRHNLKKMQKVFLRD